MMVFAGSRDSALKGKARVVSTVSTWMCRQVVVSCFRVHGERRRLSRGVVVLSMMMTDGSTLTECGWHAECRGSRDS